MSELRRARDLKLLDALDKLDPVSVSDTVWRVARSDQDPLIGRPVGGRWDPGLFDVLYTSFDPNGAISEVHFQLVRQPVFPSKVKFSLNEVSVKLDKLLRFSSLEELKPFGVEEENYLDVLYEKTQMIGDAAAFLGFNGIITPSARWECLNLIVFTDHIGPEDMELRSHSDIDWDAWNSKRAMKK